MTATSITSYRTPFGSGMLVWRGGLLTEHRLPGTAMPPEAAAAFSRLEAAPGAVSLGRRLEEYFRGRLVDFRLGRLPVDLSGFSEFERRVAAALETVPRGLTISYAGLAALAGSPRACRAVGNLMAKNPFPVLLACHRVIRSDGRPGRFSAGDAWKERLLALEDVRLPVDQSRMFPGAAALPPAAVIK